MRSPVNIACIACSSVKYSCQVRLKSNKLTDLLTCDIHNWVESLRAKLASLCINTKVSIEDIFKSYCPGGNPIKQF